MVEGLEQIFLDEKAKEVELDFKGVKIPITIRELSWGEKNQILTKCIAYNQDGTINFDYDKYSKMALSKIIVKAPWGETNNIFLARLNPAFGSMLEKLIPKAFDEVKQNDFFGKEQST